VHFQFLKRVPYKLWLALWVICATGIWFVLFPLQLTRGCWLGEWPFEQGCSADRPTGFLVEDPEKVFVEHLQKNPGSSVIYSRLALQRLKDKDSNAPQLLETALKLTPSDTLVLVAHANDNLNKQQWIEAAKSLIKLMEIGATDASEPLLRLLTSPASQTEALNLITKESVWLDKLLKHANPKFSIEGLLPIFNHGRGLGLVSAETTISIIDRLQAAGRWLDAYSLWVAYQGSLKEGLFNAGFDARVSQKAFDWKWSQSKELQKTILIRQISAHPDNGMLLEVELLGRSAIPLPMVRQHVVLFGSDYVLRGRYSTDKLQVNEGLSWKLSCASGGEPWAQSEALLDTQKQWQTFELKFKVPSSCGGAISLGLETKNPGEARVGIRGLVQFDGFSITAENTQ
jgi:hypothetical protein